MSRRRSRLRTAQSVVSQPALPSWRRPWEICGLAAALIILVVLAYQQVWHAGYIWDDDYYVTRNPTLRDLHGLWRIWFEPASTPQYYPLVHTSYWLEYHLWGLRPLGYHLDNIFLHGIASVLLWRCLLILRIPGAWMAAALFALHPVAVESVAWITERKNVLSGVFYFAAALSYFRFEAARKQPERADRAVWYSLALVCFGCALLSKTVVCSLPAALLLIVWWKEGQLRWRDMQPLVPFFVAGVALGLNTAWLEVHHVGAEGAVFSLTWSQRFLVAGRAVWFYAAKILWPAKLTFIYPRWDVRPADLEQWLFPIGIVLLLAALWFWRRKIGRGPLAAALFFIGSLFPALGFLNVYPFRYSFVADHFQYLANLGLLVPIGAGLSRLPRAIPVIVLAMIGFLTWRQGAVYENLEALWRDALTKNPGSWMVQNNYGAVLLQKGEPVAALEYFRRADELDPTNVENAHNIGVALLRASRPEDALPYLQRAEKLDAKRATVHYNLGTALKQLGRVDDAVVEFNKTFELDSTYAPALVELGAIELARGNARRSLEILQKAVTLDPENLSAKTGLANTLLQLRRENEAIVLLRQVLQKNPDDPDALKDLAWVLATSPEAQLRDGARAVVLAQRALQAEAKNPFVMTTLAAAYAENGRYDDAISQARAALTLAEAMGEQQLAGLLRSQVSLYEARQPFRDVR